MSWVMGKKEIASFKVRKIKKKKKRKIENCQIWFKYLT